VPACATGDAELPSPPDHKTNRPPGSSRLRELHGQRPAISLNRRRPLVTADSPGDRCGMDPARIQPQATSSVRDLHGRFCKEPRGVEDRGKPVRNRRSVAVDSKSAVMILHGLRSGSPVVTNTSCCPLAAHPCSLSQRLSIAWTLSRAFTNPQRPSSLRSCVARATSCWRSLLSAAARTG
jgi:hypothetical protein